MFLAGISCVSAESVDSISDISSADDNVNIDENNLLTAQESSITVYNWTELGNAVSRDSDIDTVYLGANMVPESQIKINHNVTIIGSADTYIGGDNSTDSVKYSYIPIFSDAKGLSITLKNIRFQNGGGNIFMQFEGNGTYVIDNCSFENMTATGNHQAIVYLHHGHMDIVNCTFEKCNTSYGAISNYYRDGDTVNVRMTVRDTKFEKNHAIYEPGAINNCGYLEVYDSTFEDNTASWWAGAIHTHYGAVTFIIRSKFENNAAQTAYAGGALYTYSNLTVIDSNFTENRAPSGGAIAASNYDYYGSKARVTLINCEFNNNTATKASGIGGAVMFSGAKFVAENSIFYDNIASNSGGALSISASVANITNCKFESNRAHNTKNSGMGGALYFVTTNGTLIGSTFINCSSDDGGSVYWNNSNGEMSDCSFMYSHADNNGGAVYWNGDNGTIEESTFEKCDADKYGGGIYFDGTKCTLADSIFVGGGALEGPKWYSVEPLNVTNVTTIKMNLSIYAPESVEYTIDDVLSGNATFDLILIDETGDTVANRPVNITVNGVAKEIRTDKNGVASYLVSAGVGNYTLTATTMSDELYNSSTKTAKITVNKADATLTVSNITFDYSGVGSADVSFTGATGLTAYVINQSEAIVNISDNKINVSGLDVGSYILTVTAIADADHYNVTKNATITVNKIKTQLTANAITATYNVNKNFVITLKDSNGNVLSGVKISVNLNGAKTYTTDSKGQVKVSTKGLAPKKYTAKITFNGNAHYDKSTKNAKVTIKKATPKITAKSKAFKRTIKTKRYAIILKNNINKAMKKVKVTLKVGGKTYAAKTYNNGKAIFKITKLTRKGTYKATITYKGNKYYNKVTKNVKIIAV